MPSRSFLLHLSFSACGALGSLTSVSLAQGPRGSIIAVRRWRKTAEETLLNKPRKEAK